MKHTLIVLSILATVLSGCATSRETYTADGRSGYSLNCSGSMLNWGMCEEKAGDLCGDKGYDILSRNGENVGNITNYNSSASANGFVNNRSAQYYAQGQSSLFSTPIVHRTMTIACKKPRY